MAESDDCAGSWQDTPAATWCGSVLLANAEHTDKDFAPSRPEAAKPNRTERLALAVPAQQPGSPDWTTRFLQLLPWIRETARRAFQHLTADQRDEAIQEVIANCFVAYARLVERGREERAFASPLIRYALAQHRAGRRVGCRLNRHDVTSFTHQRQMGMMVRSIFAPGPADGQWDELLVQDRHSTPADIVAIRLDFKAWLRQLTPRKRAAARLLAAGAANSEVARLPRLSSARISQLRQELQYNWARFQGEAPLPLASA